MKFDLKQTVEVAVNNNTALGKIVSYRIKNRGFGRNPLIEYKIKLYGKHFWIAEAAILGKHQPKPQTSETVEAPQAPETTWLRRIWNWIISLFKQIDR